MRRDDGASGGHWRTTQGLISVISGPAVGRHLESRNALEVHHLQHLLGLGVHLNDVLEERIMNICSQN